MNSLRVVVVVVDRMVVVAGQQGMKKHERMQWMKPRQSLMMELFE